MGRDEVSVGHRADALVRLDEGDKARLTAGVFRVGSRSVMLRFAEAGQHEDGDMFGAALERVDEQPSGLLRVRLRFWNDLAAIYVTPGASFEVWYARTVGDGVVVPWSAGTEDLGSVPL